MGTVYFEKNMESMKRFQYRLYEGCQKKNNPEIEKQLDEVWSSPARNGELVLYIRKDLTEYRMNSSYRPAEEASRWAEQYEFRNLHTVVTMYGLGNGIFARALLDRMGDTDMILLYEPCRECFEHVLENYDLTDILKRNNVMLIVEGINDLDSHFMLYSVMNIANLRSQIRCVHPNYDKIFPESCIRFYKEIKSSINSERINLNTAIYFGEKVIENTVRNLCFLKESLSFQGLRKVMPLEMPAIIVAAGPSVQENIQELKRAKGRAIIFAVDRVLEYLLDSGVTPDFVVTLDPKKKLEHFSLRENIDIPLFCYLEANPEILHHHKGKKIICSSSRYIEGLYQQSGSSQVRIGTAGSVAVATYKICVALGFQRIILVGQDLAYSNGRSHVGNVTEDNVKQEVSIEGLDGSMIQSRSDWRDFVLQYQDLIRVNPEVEVIDAKKSGARIKGAAVMLLSEAICRYGADHGGMVFSASKIEKIGITGERLSVFLKDSMQTLDKIEKEAGKAIRECDKVLKAYKRKPDLDDIDKSYKKLRLVNRFIQEQEISKLLNSYITAKTAQLLAEIGLLTGDRGTDIKNVYGSSKAVYQATIDAVDFTRDLMNEALEELEKDNAKENV